MSCKISKQKNAGSKWKLVSFLLPLLSATCNIVGYGTQENHISPSVDLAAFKVVNYQNPMQNSHMRTMTTTKKNLAVAPVAPDKKDRQVSKMFARQCEIFRNRRMERIEEMIKNIGKRRNDNE